MVGTYCLSKQMIDDCSMSNDGRSMVPVVRYSYSAIEMEPGTVTQTPGALAMPRAPSPKLVPEALIQSDFLGTLLGPDGRRTRPEFERARSLTDSQTHRLTVTTITRPHTTHCQLECDHFAAPSVPVAASHYSLSRLISGTPE